MQKRAFELLLVIFFLAVVSALAILGVREIERETRRASGAALQTVLRTVEETLHLWAENRVRDAEALSSLPEVIEITEELLRLSRRRGILLNSNALRRSRGLVEGSVRSRGYLGFFIIAPDFTNLASMRNSNVGLHNVIAEQKRGFLARVFTGETVVVPAIISDVPHYDTGGTNRPLPPTMFVATPIRNSVGKVIAAFTIRLEPVLDFSAVTRLGRIGVSGETYAFGSDGILLSESRFNVQHRELGLIQDEQQSVLSIRVVDPGGNMTTGFVPKLPIEERPLTVMAQHAVAGEQGRNTDGYRDYRGVTVFGAWLWMRELGIGLTTEIDADEALQPYFFARNVVFASVAFAAVLSLLLAVYLMFVRSKAVADLKTAGLVLESRVSERTNDLFKINESLQEQIVERVRAEENLKHAQERLNETNQQLAEIAVKDGLTGIGNRRAFDDHLQSEWNRCQRTGNPVSLIIFDVDYFKLYNDTYGHPAGDACLKRIADILLTGMYARRPGDLLARYGGEEFAIVLSGSGAETAAKIGERVRADVASMNIMHQKTKVEGPAVVTISIGVATMVPQIGDKRKSLIEASDKALYSAKSKGRNCVVVSSDITIDAPGLGLEG